MARISSRVKNYASAKGTMHKMSLMDVYYKTVELRDVLMDISVQHKKWGNEWYNLVVLSSFQEAIYAVITHGKGEAVADTISKIQELADLEAHMSELERRSN